MAFSSSPIGDVHAIPSLIATGSAPQMPMRQPASIGRPLASAISSSDWPGLGATRLLSGRKVTCGRADARRAERARGEAAGGTRRWARASRSPCSRNGFSLRSVRTNQVAASAIAAARSDVGQRLGAADRRRRTSRRCENAIAPNRLVIVWALVLKNAFSVAKTAMLDGHVERHPARISRFEPSGTSKKPSTRPGKAPTK